MKDVRALIAMTRKPDAVAIGLTAVKHLGPKAKDALPELLKLLAAADQKRKLELALLLVDIDAKSYTVTKAVSPVLVASLRPESASEAVLKAIVAVGRPVVHDIFKALEKADDIGVVNAAHRKALYQALYRLGREAYSEGNLETIRYHYKKERYRDVREEAGNALVAMKRAKNE